MTYDELIEKIWDTDGDSDAHQNALLAILKLHEPKRCITEDYDWLYCPTCEEDEDWPCKTVAIIEEALDE